MIAVTHALHLLVAVSMAAPSVAPSACAADDLHCSARAFTSAARRAKSDAERVEYLYFASRAYLALSEKPPQSPASSRDLCQAKQLIDQAVGLPATELRDRVTKSRQETRTKLKNGNIRCHPPKSRAKDDQPLVALAGPQAKLQDPPQLLPVTPSDPNGEDPQQSTVAPASEAGAPGRTQDTPSGMPKPAPPNAEDPRATVVATPEAEASARTRGVSSGMSKPAPPTPTTHGELRSRETRVSPFLGAVPSGPPPGRRLLISGGVALAAGLGLTGIAAFSGARAVAVRRTGFTSADLAASPDNMNRDAARRADYEHRGTMAVATGITGGAALVAAVVMLCVGARRKARAADSEPILMPIRAGILFSAKF